MENNGNQIKMCRLTGTLVVIIVLGFSYNCIAVKEPLKGVDNPESCNGTLRVTITGMRSDSGIVRMSLFNSEKKWKTKKGAFRHAITPVIDGISKVEFFNIPKGRYAIMLYHDRNGNDKFDKNFLGIPLENYGFSNNISPFLSLPSFESTSFRVDCDNVDIEIKVQ